MAKASPLRELYLARIEGLRRERAREAARLGLAPPVEGDAEAEVASLAERTGVSRSWVAPPRDRRRRSGSATPYLIAAAIGIGVVGVVGMTRRR